MFAADFGWARFENAIRTATIGNSSTPNGRTLLPHANYWRLCLYVTAPIFTSSLFVQLWVQDVQKAYGGYPASLQACGWTLLALLLCITPLTMGQSAPGSLPALTARGVELKEIGGNPVISPLRPAPPATFRDP